MLPPTDPDPLRNVQSLALHAAIADKLAGDPTLVAVARANLERFAALGTLHPHYADGWRRRLDGPRDELLAFLRDPGQESRDFRSASPFAGILSGRERSLILLRVHGLDPTAGRA